MHEEYDLFQVNGSSRTQQPLEVPVEIEGRSLIMELDTGASVTLISESVFNKLCLDKPLQSSSSRLSTYSGEKLPVLGQLQVNVTCGDQQARLPLNVVAGHGSSLLGRDWLRTLRLDWNCIRQVQSTCLGPLLVLGPLLFLLYIDDVALQQLSANCTINLFADDMLHAFQANKFCS